MRPCHRISDAFPPLGSKGRSHSIRTAVPRFPAVDYVRRQRRIVDCTAGLRNVEQGVQRCVVTITELRRDLSTRHHRLDENRLLSCASKGLSHTGPVTCGDDRRRTLGNYIGARRSASGAWRSAFGSRQRGRYRSAASAAAGSGPLGDGVRGSAPADVIAGAAASRRRPRDAAPT